MHSGTTQQRVLRIEHGHNNDFGGMVRVTLNGVPVPHVSSLSVSANAADPFVQAHIFFAVDCVDLVDTVEAMVTAPPADGQ